MIDRSHQSRHGLSGEEWNSLAHVTGLSRVHVRLQAQLDLGAQTSALYLSVFLHSASKIFTNRINKLPSVGEIFKIKGFTNRLTFTSYQFQQKYIIFLKSSGREVPGRTQLATCNSPVLGTQGKGQSPLATQEKVFSS